MKFLISLLSQAFIYNSCYSDQQAILNERGEDVILNNNNKEDVRLIVEDSCSGTCNGYSQLGLGECMTKSGGSPWCFVNQDSLCPDIKAFGNLHTSFKACAVWEEWSTWSNCSCSGTQTRTRACSFGGNLCEGQNSQNKNCNTTCCSCNGALHGGHGECMVAFEGKPWCFVNQGVNCSDIQQFGSFFTSFEACIDKEEMMESKVNTPPAASGQCGVISEPVRCPPQEIAFGGNRSCAERSPWNAVIQRTERTARRERISVHCGGTLISAKFVLSAAHCFWSNTHQDKSCPLELRSLTAEQCRIQGCPSTCRRVLPAGVTVFLGVTHAEGLGHTSRGVARLEIHPAWNKVASFDRSGHDLALLQLDNPVTFSDRIKPVCLPPQEGNVMTLEQGTMVQISGLGITKDSDRDSGGSDIIKHVFLNILPQTACQDQLGHLAVTGDQLCGLGPGGANICSGDSGSGLVVEEGGRYNLVGVAATSGVSCGDGVPSSFTNLLSLSKLSWVYSQMCRTDSLSVVQQFGSNQYCILPFTYVGIKYTTCTTVEDTRPWCSLKVDERGEHVSISEDGRPTWGHCEYSCPLSPGSKLEDIGLVCKDGEVCVADSICPEAQDLMDQIRGGEITKQEKKALVKKYRGKMCNKTRKPRGFCCSRTT